MAGSTHLNDPDDKGFLMMPKTVFEPSIKSRPTYGVLEHRPGTAHLMVADAEGAQALLDLAHSAPPTLWAQAMIVYIPGRSGQQFTQALANLSPSQLHISPSYAAAQPRLHKILQTAHAGLQIYLAGTESLMGQAQAAAMAVGVPHRAVQMEHRGSLARRVQCVHCKGITENVTTDPFECSHCGLNLFVRDHYSRRIAAFQGVNIDAEDPGQVPPAVERFT